MLTVTGSTICPTLLKPASFLRFFFSQGTIFPLFTELFLQCYPVYSQRQILKNEFYSISRLSFSVCPYPCSVPCFLAIHPDNFVTDIIRERHGPLAKWSTVPSWLLDPPVIPVILLPGPVSYPKNVHNFRLSVHTPYPLSYLSVTPSQPSV
jgi:hypothetical protein